MEETFTETNGWTSFGEGVIRNIVNISTKDDKLPEEESYFIFKLVEATTDESVVQREGPFVDMQNDHLVFKGLAYFNVFRFTCFFSNCYT